jgi:hypothetical protein
VVDFVYHVQQELTEILKFLSARIALWKQLHKLVQIVAYAREVNSGMMHLVKIALLDLSVKRGHLSVRRALMVQNHRTQDLASVLWEWNGHGMELIKDPACPAPLALTRMIFFHLAKCVLQALHRHRVLITVFVILVCSGTALDVRTVLKDW